MRILIIVMFLMSGCTTYDVIKEGTKVKGAEATDETDRVAIWTICKANSRGSLIRNWMQDQETIDLWIDLCLKRSNIDPQIEITE